MSYSSMTPKSTGDIPDESDWNQIVDNFAAGVPDIFTAKGQLAVGSGADAVGLLSAGANGKILTADDGETLGLKWGDGLSSVLARAKVSSTKSLLNNTITIVDYDSVDFDTNSAITTGSSWKFTAPETGYYLVQASIVLESSSSWGHETNKEEFASLLYKNGSLFARLATQSAHEIGDYVIGITGMTIVSLSQNDYIDVRAYQESGATINIDDDGQMSYVSIAKLF